MTEFQLGYVLKDNLIIHTDEREELDSCIITADSLEELLRLGTLKGLDNDLLTKAIKHHADNSWQGCEVAVKPWKLTPKGEAIWICSGCQVDWCTSYQHVNFISTDVKDMLNLSDPYASWKTKEIQKGDKVYLNPKLGPIEMEVLDYYHESDTVKVLFTISEGLEPVVTEVKRSDLIPYFED